MVKAVQSDEAPSFYFMQYDLATWRVRNLLLVPHFAFPLSAIIRRNPTTPKGRGKPWIGCNFALNRIHSDARISVVSEEAITSATEVRERFSLVRKQVEGLTVKQRGWRLDVLRVIQSLGKNEFSTSDAYAFERELEQLHPGNRNIKAKIRQQLQELRDRNLLLHVGRNCWRLP
jgi:type II restriction enzyme